MKKKTIGKTQDTSTEIRELTKNRTWLDYINNEALIEVPDKDLYRKRLMLTLLKWAEEETSIEIEDFAFEMKMRDSTLWDWSKKYPDFGDAYDYAKRMIGARRRKGALLRKFDKDVVHRDEHVYNPNRHEINVYHNNMKKDIQNDNTTKVIVLSQLDTGELVALPTKKDNDERKS